MAKSITAFWLAFNLALLPVVAAFAGTSSCHTGNTDTDGAPCPAMLYTQQSGGHDCCPQTSAEDDTPRQMQCDCDHCVSSITPAAMQITVVTLLSEHLIYTDLSLLAPPSAIPYKPPRV